MNATEGGVHSGNVVIRNEAYAVHEQGAVGMQGLGALGNLMVRRRCR